MLKTQFLLQWVFEWSSFVKMFLFFKCYPFFKDIFLLSFFGCWPLTGSFFRKNIKVVIVVKVNVFGTG